tara:strand:+ start:4026 stop:4781 length:756 start_codon:yes stop_codon:yes gene_type:complete
MARISGKSTDIYIDTSQFETFTNSFTFNVNSNLPNVTTFGDEGSTFVQGKPNADFTLNSFFSPTDNESDEIINSALTGTSEVMIAPSGLTIGNNAYEVKANLTSEGIDNPVEGATAINTSATSTESIRRSAILYTPGSTALSATGAVSASRVDTGSTSSIGTLSAGSTKTATLRVTAVSGSGTATIKIQDSSSSGSGYGDFLAFAQISGVGVQSVQTTDACERYLQINVTQYSGFTNFNCMVSMGVEVGTY